MEKARLRSERQRSRMLDEITIMKQFRHVNLIRLFEVIETTTRIYLVMELLEGGNLFERIQERSSFTESEAT